MDLPLSSECIWSWNWADVFVVLFGALLGFGFAILSMCAFNRMTRNNDVKEAEKTVLKELMECQDKKEDIIKKINEKAADSRRIIDLPILNGLFISNKIAIMAEKPYFHLLTKLKYEAEQINHWYSDKNDFFIKNETAINVGDEEATTYSHLCDLIVSDLKKHFYEDVMCIIAAIKGEENDV